MRLTSYITVFVAHSDHFVLVSSHVVNNSSDKRYSLCMVTGVHQHFGANAVKIVDVLKRIV